jgi:hypothetical protein
MNKHYPLWAWGRHCYSHVVFAVNVREAFSVHLAGSHYHQFKMEHGTKLIVIVAILYICFWL